jgi:hypothetical protein
MLNRLILSALFVLGLVNVYPYTVLVSAAVIDDLKAYWGMNEGSGNRADSHSGGYTLTDNNTVAAGTALVGAQSADFEASQSERLTRADNADISAGDTNWTWNGWLNLETSSNFQYIAGKGVGAAGSAQEWRLSQDGSQKFMLTAWAATTPTTLSSTMGSAASTATWYMVTVWHDATNNQLGISVKSAGVDQSNTSAYSSGVNDDAEPLELGGSINAFAFYDGRMDEVGFWRKVLTSDERTWLYNSGSGRSYTDIQNESGGGGGGGGATRFLLLGVGEMR